MIKCLLISSLICLSLGCVSACEEEVQSLVDRGEFSKAYKVYSKCFDKTDNEQLFALAVLHINSNQDRALLSKENNLLIVGFLRKATLTGHKKSRLLLADILNSEQYAGVLKQNAVALCLRTPEKQLEYYNNCLNLIKNEKGP
jgi:hypothetical protein